MSAWPLIFKRLSVLHPTRSRGGFIFWLLGLITASLGSVRNLPWYYPTGIDFHNMHTFQNCRFVDHPYDVAGKVCGDLLNRSMLYPPPLLPLFRWARDVEFQPAYFTWVGLIFLGMFFSLALWRRLDPILPKWKEASFGERAFAFTLAALYSVSFPAAFALERGNNDVIPLVIWSMGAMAALSGNWAFAGILSGLALMLKLYPAFAVAVVGITLIAQAVHTRSSRNVVHFSLGAAFSIIALFAWQPALWVQYLTKVLPGWASVIAYNAIFAHSLYAPFYVFPVIGTILCAIFLGAWLFRAWKSGYSKIGIDWALIFAGGLAISTYFSKTSNDYNLITAYPLLFLLSLRALKDPQYRFWALWGTLAIIGHRGWWMGKSTGHTLFEYVFLLSLAVATRYSRGGKGLFYG